MSSPAYTNIAPRPYGEEDQLRTLTNWEVEEFIGEVQQRPSLWLGKDKLWVRRNGQTNHIAFKFTNGLPHDMYSLRVVVMDGSDPVAAERYTDWLLSKFTSYAWRRGVEEFLRTRLVGWDEGSLEDIEEMARAITSPNWLGRATESTRVAVEEGARESAPPPQVGSIPTPSTTTKPVVRSRYLQNLLKKG